jgi:hypothetical protein
MENGKIIPDFAEFFEKNLEIILAFCFTIMYNVSAWAKRPMTKFKTTHPVIGRPCAYLVGPPR